MTLEDLINDIDSIDEDLMIFQKDELSINSETVLFELEDGDIVRIKNNIKYVYFLPVGMAKEFISEWTNSLQSQPTIKDTALRLLQYAMNDA